MLMPSALAVLRLMTNSNFTDCWTGKHQHRFPKHGGAAGLQLGALGLPAVEPTPRAQNGTCPFRAQRKSNRIHHTVSASKRVGD